MTNRLFVYGTLAPGRPNARVLADVAGVWEPATMTGRLVHEGWGAALGYPAIVAGQGPDIVEGLLFSSDELQAQWERLDEFEGPGYERVLTPVRVADGRVEDAYVYVLRNVPEAGDDSRDG